MLKFAADPIGLADQVVGDERRAFSIFGLERLLPSLKQDCDRVEQSGASPLRDDRGINQFFDSAAQDQQMAGEIPAVHTGDIKRRERLERARVIPVVEMPAIAFQLSHCRQRLIGALQELAGGDVTKIVRRKIGQQRDADVRGTGARRDDRGGMFLEIIGREPVLFGVAEHFEIAPGAAGKLFQEEPLLRPQPGLPDGERPAEPPGDGRRNEPQSHERRNKREITAAIDRHDDEGHHRRRRSKPHCPQEIEEAVVGVALGVAGGLPFKQFPPRPENADERANDCVEAHIGVVREKNQSQQDHRCLVRRSAEDSAQVQQERKIIRLAAKFAEDRHRLRRGYHGHAENRDRARQSAPGAKPGDQQQRQHGGGDEAAAEIVENLPPRQSRKSDCRCAESAPGTRGRSHHPICQSPRTQRCRRLTSAV